MDPLKKKSTIFVSVGVSRSNPNGNIDNGEPRRDYNGFGIISPMSIKRKIRDLLENPESPVTEQLLKSLGLDPETSCIFESRGRGFKDATSEKDAMQKAYELFRKDEEAAIRKYIDIRLFGGTILEENKDKESKAKKNKDEEDSKKRVRFTRLGVVQVDMFSSIRPIDTIIEGLTRKASTQEDNQQGEGRDDSAGSMGQAAIRVVSNAIYTGCIHVSPFGADKTFTSVEDIEVLKALIPHIFVAPSAQRAGCHILQAICLEHPDALGVVNDYNFIKICQPKLKQGFDPLSPSKSFEEYDIPTLEKIIEEIRKLKNGDKVKIIDLLA